MTSYEDNTQVDLLNKILAQLVKNIPLETSIKNTVITPKTLTLTTTTTVAIQLTSSSILVNALILTNNSTTNSIYIGFSSSNQNDILSPSGKFIYDSDIRQINLNTIYLKGSAGLNVTYTYWN